MMALRALAAAVVLTIVLLINTVVIMWCERKWAGHMQSRLGPMRTGWHGLLQPFADAIKLLGKEQFIPDNVDRRMFLIAPLLAYVPQVLMYSAMPWVANFVGYSLDSGIFMVFAAAALFPVAVLLAGWSSRNKYSVMGGFRAASQQISYEVPMIMAVLGVIMLASSMKLSTIVEAQSGLWNIVTQPFAFLLFFIGMLAELNRTPFDLPEAESELVAGYMTEYSGLRWGLFFVNEYGGVFTWPLLATLLFLGGWNGPGPSGLGIVWLLAKTYLLVFAVIWVRWALPRLRVDQLMEFGWKLLIPAAIVNIFVTALGIVTSVWVLIGLQVVMLAAFVAIISRIGVKAGDAAREAAAAEIGR